MTHKRFFTIGTLILFSLITLISGRSPLAVDALAQKSTTTDYCVQDDSGSPIVRLNSKTGQYSLDDCNGTLLAGFGSVSRYFGDVDFSFQNGNFKGYLQLTAQSAHGWVRNRSTGQTVFTIEDSQFKDNTCSCN
jgi:hypothetical protein